jgi:hypothetical protein
MNFKPFQISAVVATAVVASATFSTASASAASISGGDKLNFAGSVRLEDVSDTAAGDIWNLNFNPYNLGFGVGTIQAASSTGAFNPVVAGSSEVRISDLRLVKGVGNSWTAQIDASVNPFLTLAFGDILYNLTSFALNEVTPDTLEATIVGSFFSSGTVTNTFKSTFTTQLSQINTQTGTSFSAQIVAIPTPALLPGLVAMGIGVIRKKKQQVEA